MLTITQPEDCFLELKEFNPGETFYSEMDGPGIVVNTRGGMLNIPKGFVPVYIFKSNRIGGIHPAYKVRAVKLNLEMQRC